MCHTVLFEVSSQPQENGKVMGSFFGCVCNVEENPEGWVGGRVRLCAIHTWRTEYPRVAAEGDEVVRSSPLAVRGSNRKSSRSMLGGLGNGKFLEINALGLRRTNYTRCLKSPRWTQHHTNFNDADNIQRYIQEDRPPNVGLCHVPLRLCQ